MALKFIKTVRDASGFKHPVLVYARDKARVGNRTFRSICAAVDHIATLESPHRRERRVRR